jgi:hypothetical protein
VKESNLARNRYGWQKRAKEIARKQKNDDKMKRRQGKAPEFEAEASPGTDDAVMDNLVETDPTGPDLPAGPSQLD